MKQRTLVGLVAASIGAGVVLVAAAAESESPWPGVVGKPVVQEWFSDIPWRQKLGTYTGNKIDVAIVLPFDVLRPTTKQACANMIPSLTEPECMIEFGVTNIVGTMRADTPYDTADPKYKPKSCPSDSNHLPCIEVKLQISNFWSQPATADVALGTNTLSKLKFGTEEFPPQDYPSGFVLSDASVYSPQLPWYMSHYCDSRWKGDSQDPACYGDYISPFNAAFNGNNNPLGDWPAFAGFSVYPFATPTGPRPAFQPPNNHCKDGLDTCTIAVAAFDRTAIDSDPSKLQYKTYNDYLQRWFNRALASFPTQVTDAERQLHFAWITSSIDWDGFIRPQAQANPFQGAFAHTPKPAGSCDITFDGNNGCNNTGNQYAQQFVYPKQCSLNDLAGATAGDLAKVDGLRKCSLAYEAHPNGFVWQWTKAAGLAEDWTAAFNAASMQGNQYGRTSFLFAGVPGMQLPVPFLRNSSTPGDLTIYEKVYNASIFSMYLPVANYADNKNAMQERNYKATEFYHTLLMSNHNESDPWQFADGIRGKVLWHNEYRMQGMYAARGTTVNGVLPFRDQVFASAFKPADATAPFHNETCDGCHVRNGSGIPINTAGKLDPSQLQFMDDVPYSASGLEGTGKDRKAAAPDYTFTGQIRPMKLVFFDLRRDTTGLDASRYSEPLATPLATLLAPTAAATRESTNTTYYMNRVMNYHGDSFHLSTAGNTYTWTYEGADADRLVVKDARVNPKYKTTYQPRQIKLGPFKTGSCVLASRPDRLPAQVPWPGKCTEVDGSAIDAAVASREVGYMHLNGKRLGNLSAIEAIPSSAIVGFRNAQQQNPKLGVAMAGELVWNSGSRDGMGGTVRAKCDPKNPETCYVGRFGWLGDRASLEDQVANAAFVEMNITTREGYAKWQTLSTGGTAFPIRYGYPNCGPADKTCMESQGNGNLTETDVNRMADYARWLGNPTRSEFQVALPEVIAGEQVFRDVGCDTCHVIRRIDIIPEETMLSEDFRKRLETRIKAASGRDPAAVPFLSYIGTDLLMHDMGYLSQVAAAPTDPRNPKNKIAIRNPDGTIMSQYRNYMQKVRTPPLKGLAHNRFVTDSYRNTKTYVNEATYTLDAGCDFLLHDGRACDAIEAAFLHDGPAIKALGVIGKLNGLAPDKVEQLRAFLYSL